MAPGRKFLRSVFEIAHVEFQTYDLSNHKLIFSSGVTSRLLGYTEEEYMKLSEGFYRSIVHPDDVAKVEATIDKIRHSKAGEVFEMTARLLKKDGHYIWVYSRQMIYEKKYKDSICTMIREVEDVTKLVELEDSLKEKVEQLNLVSYKNSHLLRSPVASILGLVSLMEEQEMTGDHNLQVLHYLKETIIKLDHVIHEINDAIRLD